ncbi:unnamed protein product [Adineta steineri]|uniref:Uncharacterized protein n=1 Tax=Adineta steineri TaxID=433720 RepID=A0A814JIM4_9BILA|nr:unnamed protein product [Adineta steineri]CAF0971231.1 unnamed protein product [Adineta steineri]CAF1038552.1 unnamed protein product [Adineta steineri]
MEVYLKELVDVNKKTNDDNNEISIEFRDEIFTYDTYDMNNYTEIEQRQIIERFFFKYIDLIDDSSIFNIILNHLYAGNYSILSTNIKSYLFESLELCSPKQFLPWIYKTLENEEEMFEINIQTFTTYVDTKKKRGSTNGEIRYTILCESSTKLLELILSKISRDQLTSKQVWLAVFRLKQQLSLTSLQKDIFNEWLGIV